MAVLCRQNNIIWVNLFLLNHLMEDIINLKITPMQLIDRIKSAIDRYYHIIFIDVLFITFVYMNNLSMVLGDKSSHELSLHLAQFNHLLIIFLFFFPTLNLKLLKIFDRNFWKKDNLISFTLIFIIVTGIIYFFNQFSHTHDFLFADNRHYSFYYFRRIYDNLPIVRTVLLLYTSFIYSNIINDNKALTNNSLIISCTICSILILTPAKLFEFRYLTLCYLTYLIIIQHYSPQWKDLYYSIVNYYNIIWMIIINVITLYVFLYKPFTNSFFSGEISRFMW